MKLSRLALAVALLPASTLYVAAETNEDALKLSETVITANRTAEDRKDSTAAVTVFTRADIDRLQPTNVADLLSRVPGVQIVQNGGRGSTTSVSIRGTKTAQNPGQQPNCCHTRPSAGQSKRGIKRLKARLQQQ